MGFPGAQNLMQESGLEFGQAYGGEFERPEEFSKNVSRGPHS